MFPKISPFSAALCRSSEFGIITIRSITTHGKHLHSINVHFNTYGFYINLLHILNSYTAQIQNHRYQNHYR